MELSTPTPNQTEPYSSNSNLQKAQVSQKKKTKNQVFPIRREKT